MATVNQRIAIRDARAARELEAPRTRTDVRSLSFRLDDERYRRLRRFVISHEDQTGQRITHQAILEIALAEYLERNDLPLC
jgi:hypothetical protein